MEQNSRNKNRYQFKYFNTAGRIALIFFSRLLSLPFHINRNDNIPDQTREGSENT